MIPGLVMLLLAAIVAAIILWMVRLQKRFAREGVLGQGEVVGFTAQTIRMPEGGSSTIDVPVVEWLLPSGQLFRAVAGGSTSRYQLGQPVSLRYLPSAPDRVQIAGEKSGRAGVVILSLLSAFLFVVGVALMVKNG